MSSSPSFSPSESVTGEKPGSGGVDRVEMHMRHLRYFVVAAEEENFNRAAERLSVAQSALSRRMHDLETALGVTLFERSKKRVRLSNAGQALLEDARQILLDLTRAAARCRRIGRAESNVLRMGINDSALRHELLSRVFRDFHLLYPAIDLQIGPTAPISLLDAVTAGSVDGAFIYTRPQGDPTYAALKVDRDRLVLAMPADHPLAEAESIRLHDLRHEEFLWLPRDRAPGIYDSMIDACRAGGLSPRISHSILSETSRLHLVSEGMGVTFVTEAFSTFLPGRVTMRPVDDFSINLVLELVWRRDNRSEILRDFVSTVQESISHGVPAGMAQPKGR